MNNSQPDDSQLDRYLAGECTPQEEAALRQRFGNADPRSAIQGALRDGENIARFDSARAWGEVRSRMTYRTRAASPWPARIRLMRAAAAILFIVGGIIVVPRMIKRPSFVADGEQVVSTGVGEQLSVRLSDGTSITLAPLSSLHFPAQFPTDARSVALSGQASFSVAHEPDRPFSVRTSGLTARVLGTAFDVKEDTGARTVDVVVASGRVRLMTPTDSAGPVLTARQLGHADVVNGKITVSNDVRVDDFMGWRTGHLRFEKRALRDVIPEVERWFDVDIEVADSVLASRTLSADLRVGKSATLEALLGAITLPIDARFQRQGRSVTIVRR